MKTHPCLTLFATASLAASLALTAGCSAQASLPTEGSTSIDRGSDNVAQSFTSTALAVVLDNGSVLFIDRDTESPYYPGLDTARIVDADGNETSADALTSGNVVRVTGNGIMLESYPGQYPGITDVEIVDEGAPENLEPYADMISELNVERDPAEPAQATVEYRTEQALVSLMPQTNGYTWSYEENGEGVTVTADVADPVQAKADDLIDAQVDGPTDATVSFDVPASDLRVTRWSEADIAGATDPNSINLPGEDVQVTASDGAYVFTIEPGYRYFFEATFDAGTVGYLFTVREG
ncbi:hypothetical protein H7U34_07200 [Collinsella tanakaei]|nr:hypothetical protein [Collinsella tanakaei]